MENTDGSEGTGTKISDSAYSNSCGNSQSHRSGSSKSRHSGSNSSGSSGYGGKGSSSATNSNDAAQSTTSKRAKEKKNKKSKSSSSTKNSNDVLLPSNIICGRGSDRAAENDDRLNNLENNNSCINRIDDIRDSVIDEDNMKSSGKTDVISSSSLIQQHGVHSDGHIQKQDYDSMSTDDLSPAKIDEQISVYAKSQCTTLSKNFQQLPTQTDGFYCVVSMCEGVVLFTNNSITHALGYPQDMWLGRSFIDFIHPKDRPIFGSQITSGVASAFVETSAAENSEVLPRATLYCRIRRYRGMKSGSTNVTGFGVREREVSYAPFQLNLSFRDASEFDDPNMYLVIKALPVISPYIDGKLKYKKFSTRHTPTGLTTHVEPVALLGYLPQDVVGKSIFDFYHPEDLPYLKEVYETVLKSEKIFRSKPYRFCTQNGDYLTVESDWSIFVNPWSRKMEFVICCHYILQAPYNTDVFQFRTKQVKMFSDDVVKKSKILQEEILEILREKKPDNVKLNVSQRAKNMTIFIEKLVSECERPDKELKLEVPEDTSLSERDSVMLGEISPHHDYYDCKSSTGTPPSYNQLNYNENIQRFFESRPFTILNNELTEEKLEEQPAGKSHGRFKFKNHHSGSAESSSEMSTEKVHASSSLYPSRSHPNVQNIGDYKPAYLTEELLQKHNSVMEKLLVKKHRDERFIFKTEERNRGERREKKISNMRHLAATNPYLKHASGFIQGVKRSGSSSWEQQNDTHKITKLSMHDAGDFPNIPKTISTTVVQGFSMMTNKSTVAPMPSHLPPTPDARQDPYSNVYPAVYLVSSQQEPSPHHAEPLNFPTSNQYSVPYMMYPTTMFTSQPFLYAPHMTMAYQPMAVSNPVQTPVSVENLSSPTPSIGLPYNNYQQACQVSVSMGKTNRIALRNHINMLNAQSNNEQLEFTDTSTVVQRGSLTSPSILKRCKYDRNKNKRTNSQKAREDLDHDESSFSSFYSSFLKTETSNSTDGLDSGGEPGYKSSSKDKESSSNESKSCITIDDWSSKDEQSASEKWNRYSGNSSESYAQKNRFRRTKFGKCDRLIRNQNPPWLAEVSITSDLMYRYQIKNTQNVGDILKSDMSFLKSTNQPTLVNEQLSQLYMELQLDGLSQKLTIDEGLTSNSSSEEDSVNNPSKETSFSKLVMIYEEDAPMPPPISEGSS